MPKVKQSRFKFPDGVETWQTAKPSETLGQIVFARMNGPLWWPGVVIDRSVSGQPHLVTPKKEWVFWYGDGRISQVMVQNICSFRKFFRKVLPKQASKKYNKGIEAAIDDCALQDGMDAFVNDRQKLEWAENGFPSQSSKNLLSANVQRSLEQVKMMMIANASKNKNQQVEKKSSLDKKAKVFSDSQDPASPPTTIQDETSRMGYFKKYLSRKMNPREICIACRKENKIIKSQHPVFEGGICEECKERLKNYVFMLDLDGCMIACAVCSHTGEVLVCDKLGCGRVYCVNCISVLACENAISKFRQQNPWHCMVCRGYNLKTDGLLIPKANWWDNVTELFQGQISPRLTHVHQIERKERIRVLSLFDGISTGYYCLTQLGLNIDAYYALEIDGNAIKVSQMNFSDKITQLGDVEKFTYDKIALLCPFDLVIGGSPCNDLSAVNPARKGLLDPEGTGRLFFEYYRVLTTVQSLSSNPVFWFYENVASMPVPYRHIISRFLNCEPSLIDAKHFSAQRRPRFYWGNIPGMSSLMEAIPDSSPNLSSAVMRNCNRTAAVDKLNTVTTQRNSLKSGNQHPVIMDGKLTDIWVTEIEEVFGFPRHFTDVGNMLPQQRLGLLGKSWSVQVVTNIFKSLHHFFHAKPFAAHH